MGVFEGNDLFFLLDIHSLACYCQCKFVMNLLLAFLDELKLASNMLLMFYTSCL